MADARNVDCESRNDCEINYAETSTPSKQQKLMSTARKNSGAARYQSKFNPEWKKKYSFIVEVKNDNHSFHCTICKRDISCGHMGLSDTLVKQCTKRMPKLLEHKPLFRFQHPRAHYQKR